MHFWGAAATNSCDESPSGAAGGNQQDASSCDQVCAIENGPNAAGATSYWNIAHGAGSLDGFSKFALYPNGTGEL
jgi:hypothetical protein